MISNSLPSGSRPYIDLVAPWSDAPTSAPFSRRTSPRDSQIVDRRDLPGEVVQTDPGPVGPEGVGAEGEQTEIVVILRPAARRNAANSLRAITSKPKASV